jgi:hypothetical protein
MSVKIGPALSVIFALMAIGFGVYAFVHTEFSKGSLSILLGIVILSFALHWMGVFGARLESSRERRRGVVVWIASIATSTKAT